MGIQTALLQAYRRGKSFGAPLTPGWLKRALNPELAAIEDFVKFAGRSTKPGARVLDAGAGRCQYMRHFSHTAYESTDKQDYTGCRKHDFLCSLDRIPRPDRSYDAVVCTQVLEHVERPERVLGEFHRILKPGGKLFLSAPQEAGVHEPPHHYFNFTRYGLASLFSRAGFTVRFIRPNGGAFRDFGQRCKLLPDYALYLFLETKDGEIRIKNPVRLALYAPFYAVFSVLCKLLVPLLMYPLDRLDKAKNTTSGYTCYCVKRRRTEEP